MTIWDRFRAGGQRKKIQTSRSALSSAIAIIDASTVYGASRWHRSVHSDQTWQYSGQYKAAEDKLLFEEFLHDLLLYDSIILDNSSVDDVSNEIVELIATINRALDVDLISMRVVAPEFTIEAVVDLVCKLLVDADRQPETKRILLSTPIPWYYHVPGHHDRCAFDSGATRWGLDPALIPAAIFLYRGLCYSGYANSYFKDHQVPSVYLASPGRLKVMQPIVSTDVMHLLEYPKRAYSDLVDLLGLPSGGYDFSHLNVGQTSQVSKVSLAVHQKTPEEALDYALRLRSSRRACDFRLKWAERVWNSSQSSVVGAPYPEASNVVNGATVYGNLTMVVHAQARAY
jgi:hypothetical protein